MDTPATLDVDYDEEHHSEGAAQLEALEDQLSLHSSTSGEEHVLPDAGGSPDGIFWGILAAFCILAGLSIGLALYLKSSFALTIGDFLRRCCSKLTGASTHDPVLLNVTGRQSKDDLDKDGAEDDKRSEGSSSDEGEGGSNKKLENSTTTKVTFHKSEGDGDGTEPSEGKGKEAAKERDATDDAAEAEGQQGDAKTTEAAEESEAAAAGENRENEETKEVEAKEAQESEKRSRRSSSSSSSSSSDEESSVRQRKNAAAETAPEGEAAAAAAAAGEVEHKE